MQAQYTMDSHKKRGRRKILREETRFRRFRSFSGFYRRQAASNYNGITCISGLIVAGCTQVAVDIGVQDGLYCHWFLTIGLIGAQGDSEEELEHFTSVCESMQFY